MEVDTNPDGKQAKQYRHLFYFYREIRAGRMIKKKASEPLAGEALLVRVKQLEHLAKEEKAKECGYYTITKNGLERVNMMKFYNALLDAQEIEIDGKQSGNGRGGRSASYRITVQANGNLLIGAAYTKQMDLRPGDEFEISLGRKHIRLKQVDLDEPED